MTMTTAQGEALEARARELLAAELSNIRGQFARIAALAPNNQPHYTNGVRPFGTGDLHHFIEVLDSATAALSPNIDHAVGGVRETWQPIETVSDDTKSTVVGASAVTLVDLWDSRHKRRFAECYFDDWNGGPDGAPCWVSQHNGPEVLLRDVNITHWREQPSAPPPLSAPQQPVKLDAVREALGLARPIVEADLATANEYADGDWIGMSQTALDAIDAALATPPLDNTGLDAVREAIEEFAKALEAGGDDATSRSLNERLCCSGHECGCYGSSVGEFLAYQLRQVALATPSTDTGLDPATVEDQALEKLEMRFRSLANLASATLECNADDVRKLVDTADYIARYRKEERR